MKKEFLEFLTKKENPPAALMSAVQKDIALSFRGRAILTKFIFWQFLGALLSMAFCPQFGVGMTEGHGIIHVIKTVGDGACAVFCGSLFLSSSVFAAFIGMKGEELWWVWSRYKFSLVLMPATLWGLLMLANKSMNLPAETLSYSVIWLATAMFVQSLWLKARSEIYLRYA